jgi:hypothetical protein
MRAIASALALSRAASLPLTVYWLNTRSLNCSYDKLFEPIAGVEVVNVTTGRRRGLFSRGAMRFGAARRKPYDLFLNDDEMDKFRDQGIDLALVAAQAKRCAIETYGRFYGSPPYYADFRPKQLLLSEAERTFASMASVGGGGRIVGVHIRRGDNSASIEVSPLELFLDRMQIELDRDPEARFFLATDDPATEQTVVGHFPGRVTVRGKDFARTRTRGVQDALVDLLVLSKCHLILGSYWSSFSQTASEMGGGTLEIVRT